MCYNVPYKVDYSVSCIQLLLLLTVNAFMLVSTVLNKLLHATHHITMLYQ